MFLKNSSFIRTTVQRFHLIYKNRKYLNRSVFLIIHFLMITELKLETETNQAESKPEIFPYPCNNKMLSAF